jgi:hypothetical protein
MHSPRFSFLHSDSTSLGSILRMAGNEPFALVFPTNLPYKRIFVSFLFVSFIVSLAIVSVQSRFHLIWCRIVSPPHVTRVRSALLSQCRTRAAHPPTSFIRAVQSGLPFFPPLPLPPFWFLCTHVPSRNCDLPWS